MRCTLRSRRPRPRYHTRFMRGPSFAMAFFTYRFSSVRLKLFSALAMAERTTRPSGSAVDLGRFSRMEMASSTLLPLMSSVTRRAFLGERRRYRADAFTSTSSTRPHVRRPLRCAAVGRRDRAAVSTKAARRRELADAVTNGVLAHEGRHAAAAVVDRAGVADHAR